MTNEASTTADDLPIDDLLIIDDDEPFRVRLGRAMEKRGYRVVLAGSVKAAVAAAERERPACAVVDLRLGDGSGLDVVQALRRHAPDARVVVLTGDRKSTRLNSSHQ